MNYEFFEKKIITPKARINLTKKDKLELKKDFKSSKILILGGAGSIGSNFTLDLVEYRFKKLFIIDRDENKLSDLNRNINEKIFLNKNFSKIKNIEYICSDISNIDLNNFLKEKKISHYLNFAAYKHVRSEENFFSCKSLLYTNTVLPFKIGNVKNLKKLNKIFFISTDKAAYPNSIMAFSKRIMEYKLARLSKLNPKLFISSTRFANVSFSNGSLLKNFVEKIYRGSIIGMPANIKRFFITHQEASNICYIALLSKSRSSIVVPSSRSIEKLINLLDVLKKICKLMKKKIVYVKKISSINAVSKNIVRVKLEKKKIVGQKEKEVFYQDNEIIENISGYKNLKKLKFNYNKNISIFDKQVKKIKNLNDIYYIRNFHLDNKITNYRSYKKVSRII